MAIQNNENQPNPEPTEDLSQFPADDESKMPTPDKTILEQFDLSGCISWFPEDHKEATDLLSEFVDVFSRHNLDLGRTSVVEHKIKLEPNLRAFCEWYHSIPPSIYKKVQKHLQKMLEVGVIRPSLSLWALAVVLVWKRDGKLWFCIDLHRLNNMAVKDAYSPPKIQETLESLQGANWFMSLDLKLGYRQVRLKEECKAYTSFTVGLLTSTNVDVCNLG